MQNTMRAESVVPCWDWDVKTLSGLEVGKSSEACEHFRSMLAVDLSWPDGASGKYILILSY